MAFDVLDGGFLTTVQDGGRRGYERFGVPPAGAMDRFALAAGNRLVGNPDGEAVLEMTALGPRLYAWHDCLAAFTGGGFHLMVNGRKMPDWMAVFVREGSTLEFTDSGEGQWGYLAVSGGLDLPAVLGSRSTYLRGKFGGFEGRALQTGDQVLTRGCQVTETLRAGKNVPPEARPDYGLHPVVRVVPGGQVEAFTPAGRAAFFGGEYALSPTADRMGYRLSGPAVEHASGADILSDGVVTGAVQVPADGQPVVLMSDRQTTGGYTKMGVVASVDLPVLAQCRPGVSRVRFAEITVEAAQRLYREQEKRLRTALIEPDEDMLLYQRG